MVVPAVPCETWAPAACGNVDANLCTAFVGADRCVRPAALGNAVYLCVEAASNSAAPG